MILIFDNVQNHLLIYFYLYFSPFGGVRGKAVNIDRHLLYHNLKFFIEFDLNLKHIVLTKI